MCFVREKAEFTLILLNGSQLYTRFAILRCWMCNYLFLCVAIPCFRRARVEVYQWEESKYFVARSFERESNSHVTCGTV